MKPHRPRLRVGLVQARPAVKASFISLMALQAVPVKAQPFFVFQPFTPYVSGQTQLVVDKDLFNTRDEVLLSSQDLQTQLSGRYGGRGYFWRPWFSDLSADADLNVTHRVAGGDASASESFVWDGSVNARLQLVPRSHVPFTASLLYSRDFEQSELTRLRLNQEVRTFSPRAPDYRFDYEFEGRQRRTSENQRHHLLSRMVGDYLGHGYNAQLGLLKLQSMSTGSDSETHTYDLTADHRYNWRDDLVVSEFLSAFDSTTDSGAQEIWAGGVQANVIANWQPIGNWSANVTLSARQDETEVVDAIDRRTSRLTQYTGSGALTYRPTDAVRATLASTASKEDRGREGVSERWSHDLDVYYSPALIRLGEFDYRWDASTSFRVSRVDSVQTEDGDVNLAHRASRRWGGGRSEWTLDASQDLEYGYLVASEYSPEADLSQRVSLSWRGREQSYQDFAQLSVSDARRISGGEAEAQSLDASFNRQGVLGAFSSWEFDVNYQLFREVSEEGVVSNGSDASSRGALTLIYRAGNMWGIYNLFFRSELDAQLNYEKDDDSVMRDSRWENALEYQLGRLSAELSFEITEADDGATGGMFLEVRRRWDSR